MFMLFLDVEMFSSCFNKFFTVVVMVKMHNGSYLLFSGCKEAMLIFS